MDRLLLVGATLFFLAGFAHTMYALGARVYRPAPWNYPAMVIGFGLQTLFLFQRGQEIGRCPLTNLFEVFIFLSWSMVLLYLIVGPAYRLSLLGAFTSPLVFVFQTFALIAPIDVPGSAATPPNPWLELHAASSIVAYGAFALACVAGAMFLAQERQLKTHRLRPFFFALPPIADLAVANRRLLLIGFALLTIGVMAGFGVGLPAHWGKRAWSLAVWAVYGAIVFAEFFRQVSPRRVALLSILVFSLTLTTLWGLSFITDAGD